MRRRRSAAPALGLAAALALAAWAWVSWRGTKPAAESGAGPEKAPAPGSADSHQPAAPETGPSAGATGTNLAGSSEPKAAPLSTNATGLANALLLPEKNVRGPEAGFPRPVENVFEMQVALARRGISCGSIDGLVGPQTRAALESFQRREHLAASGQLDQATRSCLVLTEAPTTRYMVSSNDLARLQPLSPTWLGKSKQTSLDYETVLELVSEKAQAHPALVRRLNPQLDWSRLTPGTWIEVPKVGYSGVGRHAAFLTIGLEAKILEAWDENTNLLAHFPCSIARQMEKRPLGELHVVVIALNPNYTFDPENFPESAEARQLGAKLVLPPGPNNPVGTAWIGLDKPGYGIHGTPRPEQVGRTESHGCFRLANWNAEYLARLVALGTPVYVEP